MFITLHQDRGAQIIELTKQLLENEEFTSMDFLKQLVYDDDKFTEPMCESETVATTPEDQDDNDKMDDVSDDETPTAAQPVCSIDSIVSIVSIILIFVLWTL